MSVRWTLVENSGSYFLSVMIGSLSVSTCMVSTVTFFFLLCVSGRFQKRGPLHQKSLPSSWACLSSWLRKGKWGPHSLSQPVLLNRQMTGFLPQPPGCFSQRRWATFAGTTPWKACGFTQIYLWHRAKGLLYVKYFSSIYLRCIEFVWYQAKNKHR